GLRSRIGGVPAGQRRGLRGWALDLPVPPRADRGTGRGRRRQACQGGGGVGQDRGDPRGPVGGRSGASAPCRHADLRPDGSGGRQARAYLDIAVTGSSVVQFVVSIVFVSIIACCRQAEITPSRQARAVIERPVPGLPAGWQLDSPLRLRKAPACSPDPFASEALAFLKGDLRFELVVKVAPSGHVERTDVSAANPSPPNQRLLEYARACVANAVFEQPPHQPYEMRFTVRFSGRR